MDVDNYSYDYEGRKYLDPTVSRGEQLDFINTFRSIQDQNNAQINEQTHNLGRDLPSNLGGLSGSEGYFQSRYQTPQVNAMAANLNAAAQASALNQVLNNLQSQYKQRYAKAQQNYQSRASRANSGNNLGDSLGQILGGIEEDPNDVNQSTAQGAISANASALSRYGNTTTEETDGYVRTYDSNGNLVNTDDPSYVRVGNYMYPYSQVQGARDQAQLNFVKNLAFPIPSMIGQAVNTIRSLF